MGTQISLSTPDAGLSSGVVAVRSAHTAPEWNERGTAVSAAGTSAPVQVAFGARVMDLPGRRPRGAPV